MFGYVKPFKPLLRVCEYDTYKAVYCGLCKQLSHSYGPFARLTLSYDFTFLALLDMAYREQAPAFKNENCLFNPLKKRPCCQRDEGLHFSASCAMLMLYYKLMDNIQDEAYPQKLIYYMALPMVRRAYRKARADFSKIDGFIAQQMKIQALLEQNKCSCIDEACEPTAKLLSAIFQSLTQDDKQNRILERFGYFLGRWIYMADALDDLEEDVTKGRYNVFSYQEKNGMKIEEIRNEAILSLNLTIGELIKTFDLLEFKRYRDILGNVINYGLKNTVNQIVAGDKNRRQKAKL